MAPLISTAWSVFWLLYLVAKAGNQDGKSAILAWLLIGVFPPVFYKIMSV